MSPEVWLDARPRIEAAALALGATVQWPNEAAEEPEADVDGNLPLFLAVEADADGAEPLELGGGIWQETGTLYVHVLVPTGSGVIAANAARKQIADAFRGLGGGALWYESFSFPTGGADEETGNWYRATLGISYRFTDA